jgi:hypothetical protein
MEMGIFDGPVAVAPLYEPSPLLRAVRNEEDLRAKARQILGPDASEAEVNCQAERWLARAETDVKRASKIWREGLLLEAMHVVTRQAREVTKTKG